VTSYVIARTLGDPTASTSHKSSFATQLPPKSDCKNANADSTIGLHHQTVLADRDPDPDPIPISVLPPEEDASSTRPTLAPASSTPAAVPDTGAITSSRTFFVDGEGSEDDGAARLAGVGVFSPVASMPGSPTVSRGNFFEKDGEDEDDAGGGGSASSDESGSPFVAPRGVLLRSSIHHHHQHHQGGREAETEKEHEHSRSASDGGGGGGGENGGGSTSGESSFAILDREESFEDAGVHIRRRLPGGAPGASSADE